MGLHRERGSEVRSIFNYECLSLTLLQGFDLAQVQLIFHPVWSTNVYLIYVEQFDIVSQPTHLSSTSRARCPDPVTGMYVVKRSS